jgi:hypothetical protein
MNKALYKSERSRAWRNMMVAAINVALEREDIGLNLKEGRTYRNVRPDEPLDALCMWQGRMSADSWNREGLDRSLCETTFEFENDGIRFVAYIGAIGCGELWVSVAANPKHGVAIASGMSDESLIHATSDARAAGWLERKNGKWLQHDEERPFFRFTAKNVIQPRLAAMKVEPRGYKDSGHVYY